MKRAKAAVAEIIGWAEQTIREFLRPTDPLPLDQWAEKYYELDKSSAVPGKFSRALTPWLCQPLLDFQNPEVSSIFLQLGAQLHKTSTAGIAAAWAACEEPGPALWFHADEQQLKEFVEQRLFDSWGRSEPVAKIMPTKEQGRTLKAVNFASMALSFISAQSKANRTGRPARYVFGDEIKDWEAGTWETVKRRTSTWLGLSKVFGFSTPKQRDDDVDKSFKEGDQNRWHMDCPYCKSGQEILWQQVEWDKHLTPDGEYDLAKILPSVRLTCRTCKAVIAQGGVTKEAIAREVQQRYALLRSGRWIPTNPSAMPGVKSYTANALINPRIPLAQLVSEYLKAKHAEKLGTLQDLVDFYNQRLSLPWDDFTDDADLGNKADYKPEDLDATGGIRVMTVDVQILSVMFALIWQWDKVTGKAHFVACKECHSWDEIALFGATHQVKPQATIVDFGDQKNTVLAECLRRKWKAFRGSDKEAFPWEVKKGLWVNRPVSREFFEDPAVGTAMAKRVGQVSCRYWSNLQVKDILSRMVKDKSFVVPADVDAEFSKQMNSERKVKSKSGKSWIYERIGKRPNHYWDCAAMQVAVAICLRLIKLDLQPVAIPPTPSASPEVSLAE